MEPTPDNTPTHTDSTSNVTAPGVAVDYAQPEPPSHRRGKGFLAAAANLYIPGLGHFIAGKRGRGGLIFAVWLVLVALTLMAFTMPGMVILLPFVVPAQLLLIVVAVVAGFRSGRRSAARMLGRPVLRYLAGIAFVVAPQFWLHPLVPVLSYMRETSFEAFRFPAASMSPTIAAGDHFLVHKRFDSIERWEIVVFDSPDTSGTKLVFRVVGLPGEAIAIMDGEVHVNGSPVARPPGVGPYQVSNGAIGGPSSGPITLAPDEYFVLGDNSAIAKDSRYWEHAAPGHQLGALPRDRIIGKVTAVYWPLRHWERF